MRRGGPGLAALDRSLYSSAQFSTLGSELTASQVSELHAQLDVFASALRQFAQQHRRDIVRDPAFRHAFQQMCANIGVDPLAGGPPSSSLKSSSMAAAAKAGGTGRLAGLWNDFLGLRDFQNELSIQIIDACVSTRELNGGYIDMRQLVRMVNKMRTGIDLETHAADKRSGSSSRTQDNTGFVTEQDIVQSIKLLQPLGSGYEVVRLPSGVSMVRSVPKELDVDSTTVLALLSSAASNNDSTTFLPTDAFGQPYVTEQDLMRAVPLANKTVWTRERAHAVLLGMSTNDGLLWIDEGIYPARYYAALSTSQSM